jgi:hypothetical protein
MKKLGKKKRRKYVDWMDLWALPIPVLGGLNYKKIDLD